MKKLRKVLVVLIVILVIFLGIGLILPGKYTISRSIVVNTNKETVFQLVGDLQQWKNWAAWAKSDPEAAFTYTDPSYGLKATMSWDGKKIGSGSLRFVQFSEDNAVHYQVTIVKPYPSRSKGGIMLEEVPEGTRVTWTDHLNAPYPLGRYMYAIMGVTKKIGKQFDEGLTQLKAEAEKLPRVELPEIEVEVERHYTQWIASRRLKVPASQVSQKIGEAFSEIVSYLQGRNITPLDTAPVCFFYRRGLDTFDIKPGIMISAPLDIKDPNNKIQLTALYEGPLAQVKYYGAYDKITPVYKAFKKWLPENNMQSAADPWEVYITDPMSEPDTAKWLTIICFPVKSMGGEEKIN